MNNRQVPKNFVVYMMWFSQMSDRYYKDGYVIAHLHPYSFRFLWRQMMFSSFSEQPWVIFTSFLASVILSILSRSAISIFPLITFLLILYHLPLFWPPIPTRFPSRHHHLVSSSAISHFPKRALVSCMSVAKYMNGARPVSASISAGTFSVR